jgi:hypothetical protein
MAIGGLNCFLRCLIPAGWLCVGLTCGASRLYDAPQPVLRH